MFKKTDAASSLPLIKRAASTFGKAGRDDLRREFPDASPTLSLLFYELDIILKKHQAHDAEIAVMLDQLAQTIQVSVPTEQGLIPYYQLLGGMPRPLIEPAVLAVLSTHRYRTMPLPAEILAHVNPSWAWHRYFIQQVRRALSIYEGTTP